MLKWYIDLSNRIAKSRKGASMVEYALVVVVIAVVALIGFTQLGGNINNRAVNVAAKVGNP